MAKTASIPNFIVAINQQHEVFIVQEPKAVNTEEYAWFSEERGFLAEAAYPSVKPGLWVATAKFEWWTDYFTGEHDGISFFDDFLPVVLAEDIEVKYQ